MEKGYGGSDYSEEGEKKGTKRKRIVVMDGCCRDDNDKNMEDKEEKKMR